MDDHIYKAAINGNINVLTENEDKVRDQETHDKNTVLHLASQLGKTECVQRILKMHPFLLWKLNSASETVLHLAAKQGHAPVVKALIEEANITQCTPDLEQRAKVDGSISLKETMIRMVNKEKDTALHEAARYNRVDVVRLLVNEDKEDSHTTNKDDESPLYVAAYRGYNDVVQVICGTCTSPAYGGSDGRTVLHAAVISHNPAMLAYLLWWKKLLIKETDKHGWTALHYAAHFNYTEEAKSLLLAEKLVAYKADKCENRSTALHIAANIGNINVMKEIIAVCPDCFTMVDNNSQNVLHIAAKLGNKDMIAYIFRNCVVISSMLGQKDTDGNTPLHLLAQSGCYFPEILQHEMADKEALNNEKMTPLDVIFCVDQVLAEQVNVQNTLIENHANSTWNLWRAIKGDKVFKRKKVDGEKKIDSLKKMGETHMIVAALIAAISFTAGFTLPGGFNGNEGPNHGMAILTRKSAFKAFIITNTISLVFSSSSLVMYFLAAIYKNAQDVWKLLIAAIVFNLLAIVAMVLAFITGTYVVLPHPSLISVAVCVIGCSFFVIQSFTLRKCYRTRKRIVQFVENVNMSYSINSRFVLIAQDFDGGLCSRPFNIVLTSIFLY